MADPRIIKHPLEQCVSFGNLSDLDPQGRLSLDLIMTMIGDLRFRKDSIEGMCARYFLLVDHSVIHNLCLSAHINCDKLRDHIRRFDTSEVNPSEPILDDTQSDFPFLVENGPMATAQEALLETQTKCESDQERTVLPPNRDAKASAERQPRDLQIQNMLNGPATPQASAPLMKSSVRGSRPIERQGKHG